MEFEGGRTASFTMTGFNLPKGGGRQTRIFGTHGEIMTNSIAVEHTDFLTEKTVRYDTNVAGSMLDDGHGGGDHALMSSFISVLSGGDRKSILSGPEETLETHFMVFAAERARLSNGVEEVHVPDVAHVASPVGASSSRGK
jgi:hypothetical protein